MCFITLAKRQTLKRGKFQITTILQNRDISFSQFLQQRNNMEIVQTRAKQNYKICKIMKKTTILYYLKFILLLALTSNAQNDETSTYDKIWDKVNLYENEENSLISKFWLTGRLQGVWTRDLDVDNLHKQNNQFCQVEVEKDPSLAASVFEVLFISKSLERVCDHAVNISKETVFIATSRDIRHAPEFKKSALRKELK